MKHVILLKLGGSLITDKTNSYTLRLEYINQAAKEIKEALDTQTNVQLIIATGTGSFGHYPAVEYGVKQTVVTEKQKKGVMVIREAVVRLNGIVVKALVEAGVNATALSPNAMFISDAHQLKHSFVQPVFDYVSQRVIPVLHGDMILDTTDGAKIMSSDELLIWLAEYLGKEYQTESVIIHAGVTDGVLDKEGNTISQISSLESLYFDQPDGFDVTGGMKHKVETSLELAQKGIYSIIINGTTRGQIKNAILGHSVEGTTIQK